MARAASIDRKRFLPAGWRWVRFGDVVRNVNATERNPREAGLERYVGLEHLDPESLHVTRWGLVGEGTTFTRKFVKGQVLFAKRRAYQRKVAVADFEGVCSGDLLVFEVKDDLLSELLPFIVKTDRFFTHVLGTSAGSLSPRTKWTELAKYEFALPPKHEQRRIAEIMWSIDEWDLRAELVESSLQKLRDSIIDEMSRLPKGWEVTTIGTLVDEGVIDPPQDGNHGELHPKAKDYTESGVPFVMANNIRDGELQLDGCKRIPRDLADSLRVGFSIEGDVLLTHKGTVGEVAIVPQLHDDYVMLTPQVTYYRVADKTRLNHRFLFISFMSRDFQRQLSIASAQSTRSYVGVTAQRKLRLPLPPLEEQDRVVGQLGTIERRVEDVRRVQATERKIRALVLDTFLRPAL